ncbi:hypothetical protein [Vibrio agarivorans]|uniref:hypothetical protein n=1 Tax=Vibrio agarivorans TaxID=153622 RepID=UPI0025B4C76B|nr:hypothetical protein [Vibrio agarivorans]MDN3659946.1 hypothetical protein [Vibrio agarivorans]
MKKLITLALSLVLVGCGSDDATSCSNECHVPEPPKPMLPIEAVPVPPIEEAEPVLPMEHCSLYNHYTVNKHTDLITFVNNECNGVTLASFQDVRGTSKLIQGTYVIEDEDAQYEIIIQPVYSAGELLRTTYYYYTFPHGQECYSNFVSITHQAQYHNFLSGTHYTQDEWCDGGETISLPTSMEGDEGHEEKLAFFTRQREDMEDYAREALFMATEL